MDNQSLDNKLLPVLRDGVEVIKLIFFKELKTHLTDKYPDRENRDVIRLSGAIINDLFGTPNNQEPFATFYRENRALIEKELQRIPAQFEQLLIPVTDALRMQFLCDSHEGMEKEAVLTRANEMGILLKDREVPLPKTFMNMVRRLGVAFNVLEYQNIEPENSQTVH